MCKSKKKIISEAYRIQRIRKVRIKRIKMHGESQIKSVCPEILVLNTTLPTVAKIR